LPNQRIRRQVHRLTGDRVRVDVHDDLRKRRPRRTQGCGRRLHGEVARREARELAIRVVESDRDRLRKGRPGRADLEDRAQRPGRALLPAKLDGDVQVGAERAGGDGDRDAPGPNRAAGRSDVRGDEIPRRCRHCSGDACFWLDNRGRRRSARRGRRQHAVGDFVRIGAVVDAVHVPRASATRNAQHVAVGVAQTQVSAAVVRRARQGHGAVGLFRTWRVLFGGCLANGASSVVDTRAPRDGAVGGVDAGRPALAERA
jgi:hypothetical protein